MIINNDKKYVFIHIPKTGGKTISYMLDDTEHTLANTRQVHNKFDMIENRITSQYFVFAFVRNPWDRLYSFYEFMRGYPKNKKNIFYETHHIKDFFEYDFKTWLLHKQSWCGWYKEEKNDYLCIQREQQVNYLKNSVGTINISYIARFEDIENEYKTICSKLNIPVQPMEHLNKSVRKKNYREAYDQEMIDFVYKYHSEDIKTFKYEF